MRDDDLVRKEPEVDAAPRDARGDGASKASKRKGKRQPATADAATETTAWFSGASLRRRMSLYQDQQQDSSDNDSSPSVRRRRSSDAGARRSAARWTKWAAGAAGATAALLVVGVSLIMLDQSGAKTYQQADAAMGGYLRSMKEQYERTATGGGGVPPDADAFTTSMSACAARSGPLPSVTLPPLLGAPSAAGGPPLSAEHDPVRAADLDCTADGNADACSAVAWDTNSYEGDAAAAEDLAGYLADWEAYAAAAAIIERAALASAHVPSALDALALDCGADPAACAAVADASNSYEGGNAVAVDNPEADAESGVDSLSLDCSADPAACTDISAASNSYEEGGGALDAAADEAAAAEAQGFLDERAAEAAQGGAVGALSLDCSADGGAACEAARQLSNAYEGAVESDIQRSRVAEEAASETLGVDALALDCWGPAGDGNVDPAVAAECARSSGANSYEGDAPEAAAHAAETAANGVGHAHHHHHHSHGAPAPAFVIGADGLPVSGPVQGYYSWIVDAEGPTDASIAQHAQSYEEGAAAATATRTGHDAPAVEWDPLQAARDHQAALAARRAAADKERQEAELYFAQVRQHAEGYKAAAAGSARGVAYEVQMEEVVPTEKEQELMVGMVSRSMHV